MDKLDFLIERIQLLEQRMKVLEEVRSTDRSATILTMQEMSRTIGMVVAQLLPILNERQVMKKVMEDATIEQVFEYVKKTQKYPM